MKTEPNRKQQLKFIASALSLGQYIILVTAALNLVAAGFCAASSMSSYCYMHINKTYLYD